MSRPITFWVGERPPAGPFLNDQKGAKESVKEGDGVAASCASLASPFGELSSAPLRFLSHPHPLRWAADGSPASPFPTPIPLKRPSTGRRGPKWSPAKRVHLGEEEQGSGPNFRRQAEMEGSGLCDDDGPPIGSTPRALLQPRLSAPAAYVVTPPVQGAQVRRRRGGDLGLTAKHFRRIKPFRFPFRGVTHPCPVWSTNQAAWR